MIGFLLRRLSQVPVGDDWLTAAERRWLDERRSAKRVADWRLGRWTARQAIIAFLGGRQTPAPAGLEVLAAEDGAPEAFAGGRPLPLALSISHSHGRAMAAVADAGIELGCDLERVEPRSAAFLDSYFTGAERAALAAAAAADREVLANLLWSAKESALKALRRGLRADTRSVEVRIAGPPDPTWGRLEIRPEIAAGVALEGCWRRIEDLIVTIASRAPVAPIVDLDQRARQSGTPPHPGS